MTARAAYTDDLGFKSRAIVAASGTAASSTPAEDSHSGVQAPAYVQLNERQLAANTSHTASPGVSGGVFMTEERPTRFNFKPILMNYKKQFNDVHDSAEKLKELSGAIQSTLSAYSLMSKEDEMRDDYNIMGELGAEVDTRIKVLETVATSTGSNAPSVGAPTTPNAQESSPSSVPITENPVLKYGVIILLVAMVIL